MKNKIIIIRKSAHHREKINRHSVVTKDGWRLSLKF